jgi:hypothetical protein
MKAIPQRELYVTPSIHFHDFCDQYPSVTDQERKLLWEHLCMHRFMRMLHGYPSKDRQEVING